MHDFIALGIMCFVVGVFAYCFAPDHWQNPLGFMIIVGAIVPVGFVVLALLSTPALLIPAALVMGVFLVGRRAP